MADVDRVGLIGLIQDLYAANKDNQTFLHARFGLGEDILKPYKDTISRWICPDVMRNQPISVAKAKKAITDYKKALGQPEGLAELSVFYCEEVFVFLGYCGMDDEGYFDALVRMFEQALKYVMALPEAKRPAFIHSEPPRFSRRLQPLREWSNERENYQALFIGNSRTSDSHGAGASR
ncbi:hypothetical protein RO575_20175 [Methylomonas sp. MO1]|uniref:hypothetical protein n=1 Tax=Methylomonas sp. MO1 TaxID=3073619 RepID=UPI0028A3D216|nr:hypothetical protein [Methylomonas sp. MO1]MDT4291887.1 hypothetical protein [Methylomonas sp. MO1]